MARLRAVTFVYDADDSRLYLTTEYGLIDCTSLIVIESAEEETNKRVTLSCNIDAIKWEQR